LVLPVCGTLRGAGDEKAGRCFEGVLVEGVGVAMVAGDGGREGFKDRISRVSSVLWMLRHLAVL
jgi:hypothetical protein